MEKRKLTKADIDKVRNIDGFPIGSDEDIIALSDAPYYTACPNPFIEDFIKEHGKPYDEKTDDYHREPFAADVSEGKYDPIYKLHTYHTKVPHKAIMRYILHYTDPNDLILDGFSGTGMTSVAAQCCAVPDLETKVDVQKSVKEAKWGQRYCIINDLSPISTFIAAAYNRSINIDDFMQFSKNIMKRCHEECDWMFETKHDQTNDTSLFRMIDSPKGIIKFVVWSDLFICPNCGDELLFWNCAVDQEHGKVHDKFKCHNCNTELKKSQCKHAIDVYYDTELESTVTIAKQVPVLISYIYQGKRYQKKPDQEDLDLIEKIKNIKIPYWVPTDVLIDGDKTFDAKKIGIDRANLFYTKRSLYVLSVFWHYAKDNNDLKFAFTKVANHMTKQYRLTYMNGCWGAGGGPMSGTFYIPSLLKELNVLSFLEQALEIQNVRKYATLENSIISTQSTTNYKQIADNCIDYIFTDPPFGSNLMYSELNFLWERWLQVSTNNFFEAVVNQTQQKNTSEYLELMTKCFSEYYRVLKPGRWITIEFHNSKNTIWNAIQTAIGNAGFIIADVRTLDKQHSSYNQVNAMSQAIKQDLVISAYKPSSNFTRNFILKAGTEDTAWAFVRQHLKNLPVIVQKSGKIEIVAERQAFLLFDRMVVYHIMKGIQVPIDASNFYKGLDEHFLKRDGMYFLPDQVNEYDLARSKCEIDDIQIQLFVSDEKSAIGWLYQQLNEKSGAGPQTYQELSPKFMQELKSVDKREKMPELITILEENFLIDDNGRWYIPDITKSGDIAKLREKNLLKEFQEYLNSKGKLKVFRSEAIRTGFAKLWKEKDYASIVSIAERLPEQTIQEDQNLLMYYDNSLGRV